MIYLRHYLILAFLFFNTMISSMHRLTNINKNVILKQSFRLNALYSSPSSTFSTTSTSSNNALYSSPSSTFSTTSTSSNNVRVVTYNVLSSSLAEPDYFFTNKPEDLSADKRLQRLCKKLDDELALNSIICLQELSTQWTSKLHTYFYKNNYYLITGLYGNKFNGYMGVGIAVPIKHYNINDIDITRIADTYTEDIKEKRVYDNNTTTGIMKSLRNQFKKILVTIGSLVGFGKGTPNNNVKEKLDPWYESNKKMNQMVIVKLESKNKNNNNKDSSFYVGTYHMPCMFKLPAVMMIHCAASAKYIQKIANGKPYIYCGDFNIMPESLMYDMLTSGKGNMTTFNLLPYNNFKFELEPLKSAYKEYNNVEPLYTNYAQTKGSSTLFKGTLDYIFLSKDWKVQDVVKLPTEYPQLGLPSSDEPSDHILLGASVSLLKD